MPGFPATIFTSICFALIFKYFPCFLRVSLFIWFFFCLLSDSFSGTNPYRNTALFQSEPPALAGLFRGTYTEVKIRNLPHNSSLRTEEFCECCFCVVFVFDFWGNGCWVVNLFTFLFLYMQHSFFLQWHTLKTKCNGYFIKMKFKAWIGKFEFEFGLEGSKLLPSPSQEPLSLAMCTLWMKWNEATLQVRSFSFLQSWILKSPFFLCFSCRFLRLNDWKLKLGQTT